MNAKHRGTGTSSTFSICNGFSCIELHFIRWREGGNVNFMLLTALRAWQPLALSV